MTKQNKKESKNFIREVAGLKVGTFTGKAPRQAALKAATGIAATKDKPAGIILREAGTDKLHVFVGWVEKVKSPDIRPKWIPEIVNRPFVKKIRTERKKDVEKKDA